MARHLSPLRLTLLLAAATLGPVALLSVATVKLSGAALHQQIDARLRNTAEVVSVFVGQNMGGLAQVVEAYAKRPEIAAAVAGGHSADRRVEQYLDELRHTTNGVTTVFTADMAGVLGANSPPALELRGKSFAHRNWFRGVLTAPGPYISEIYFSSSTGSRVSAVATLVRTRAPGRTPVGILAAAYDTAHIREFAEKFARAQGVSISITDQRGVLVAASEGVPHDLASHASEHWVSEALAGRSGTGELDQGGVAELVGWAAVPDLGWTVLCRLNKAAAIAPLERLQRTVIAIASVISLALFGVLVICYMALVQRRRVEQSLRLSEARTTAMMAAARDHATETSRLKSAFLANMSHEIRTPLNGVLGMTTLLLETRLDGEQRQFAETIRSSGDTLLSLLNDILDISKIEADKLELEQQLFDPRACLEDVLELFAARAADKGIELYSWIAPEVPTELVGDPTRLGQIFSNLVSNAIKFTSRGEVVAEMSLGAPDGEDPGTRLSCSVRDTGPGIPAEQIPLLFMPFQQGDASVTRQFGGTGLGLAISRRLCELMGGGISVESAPGVGTTFRFWTRVGMVDFAKAPVGIQFNGLRVLLVMRDGAGRRILLKELASLGCAVVALDEAPASAEPVAQRYAVALLDHAALGADARPLAVAMRTREAPQPPAIVLLTSPQESAVRRAFEAAVPVLHLLKPIKHAALTEILSAAAEGRRARAAASSGPARSNIDSALSARCPLRLLVVEDNSVNQQVMLHTLRRLGYRADLAGNGEEALAALERGAYQTILMDVQMPVMDGLTATSLIRANRAVERPYIIAMTASALRGDREKCLAAGMDDYVTKPVQADSIAQALERAHAYLSRAKNASPGAAQATGPDAKAVLDQTRLRSLYEMAGDVPGAVQAFIRDHLADSARLAAEMHVALGAADAESLERAAHSLQGSTGLFGAHRLVDACLALATHASKRGTPGAADLLALVDRELAAAHAELEAELRAPSDQGR
jgi:signal transduction histidine kinase/DNA-binding response OmpR family regulator